MMLDRPKDLERDAQAREAAKPVGELPARPDRQPKGYRERGRYQKPWPQLGLLCLVVEGSRANAKARKSRAHLTSWAHSGSTPGDPTIALRAGRV